MRTLERNKTRLWMVKPISTVETVDSDGFFTGEKSLTYSVPVVVKIHVTESSGDIVTEIFGIDYKCDLVGISNEYEFDGKELFFLSPPTSENYSTEYDYRIDRIVPSLNTRMYGLRRRS